MGGTSCLLFCFLDKIVYVPEKAPCIPVSGLNGDNLINPSVNCPWYKGWPMGGCTVKTLLETIDAIRTPLRPSDKALRLPVSNVYDIPGIGKVPVGCVQTGSISSGMAVTFAPANITREVKSVQMHHHQLNEGRAGDIVGFNIKDVSGELQHGNVAGDAQSDPPTSCASFISVVVIIGECKFRSGYTPVVDCHTAYVSCRFELLEKIDRRSGKVLENHPLFLKTGDTGKIKMTPTKPMCVETFSAYPPLGRIIVRDLKKTIGIGHIKEVEKSNA